MLNWFIYIWGGVFGYFITLRFFMLPTGMEPYENLTVEACDKVRLTKMLIRFAHFRVIFA